MSNAVRGTLKFVGADNVPNGPVYVHVERVDGGPVVEVRLDDPCGLSVDNRDCTVKDFLAWWSVHYGERVGVLLTGFREDLIHGTGAASADKAGFFSE